MNLSQLIDGNNNNTYYLPAAFTNPQIDFCEILLKLHSNHLKTFFFKNGSSELDQKLHGGTSVMSDSQMLNLLYSNLNLTSNNPYLLVDHYIPKKMLLMNTKFSLMNISGKFQALNNIICQYETFNYRKSNKQFNVLLLADSSKELDFIESLLVGRFINYQRYTGTKLFESNAPKANSFRFPTSSDVSSLFDLESNNSNPSSKDDIYLLKRLKKKHRRTMRYLKNNSSNKGYCLTIHLITIDQLKFQFFENTSFTNNNNTNLNYNFLDLKNTINFDYIISFNSYLNLNQYHLKKLRSGIIDTISGKLKKLKILTPVLFLVPENSIENTSIKIQDWLIDHKIIDTNASTNLDNLNNNSKRKSSNCGSQSIDERVSRYDYLTAGNGIDSENCLMILSFILMIYIMSRHPTQIDNSKVDLDFNNINDWWYEGDLQNLSKLYAKCQPPNNINDETFESLMMKFSADILVPNKRKLKKSQKINNQNETQLNFEERFEKLVKIVNSTIVSYKKTSFIDELKLFNLKYPNFEKINGSLISSIDLLKQCLSIIARYSNALLIFKSNEHLAHLKKDFFDNSLKSSSESYLHIDIETVEACLSNIKNLIFEYKQIQKDEESRADNLVYNEDSKEWNNIEQYKKRLTKLIKNRSESLNLINELFYNMKLIEENKIGNYLQIQMEKNNYFSKVLFDQKLKIIKNITKLEKILERLYSDFLKIKNDEELIHFKIEYFNKNLLKKDLEKYSFDCNDNLNENLLLEKELTSYMHSCQQEKQKIIEELKTKEEIAKHGQESLDKVLENEKPKTIQKANEPNAKNDESKLDIIEETKYYFSLNHEQLELDESTNKLNIRASTSADQISSCYLSEIRNNQLLIIKHLEKEILQLENNSRQVNDTTETSRLKYQENSSLVTLQIENIKSLDNKISAIEQTLKRKPLFFGLKKLAFENNPDSAFDSGLPGAPKLFNLSNLEQNHFANYARQKEFLVNYFANLKALNKSSSVSNKRSLSSSGGSEELTPTPSSNSGNSKRNGGYKRRRGNN